MKKTIQIVKIKNRKIAKKTTLMGVPLKGYVAS